MAAVAIVAALVAGCAGSGGGKGGKGKPACKPPATPTVCFSSNIQPIFNKSCALSSCHVPAAQFPDLSAGDAYHAIVGVKSRQQANLQLINPGNPANSYIVRKIIPPPSPGPDAISGVQMPQGCPAAPANGAQCLTADETSALSQWVTECALNTTPCP